MSVHHTDQSLIAHYIKAAGIVAQEEAALKERLVKIVAGMEACKAELMKRLIERKADNTKTEAGTAYLSDHLNIKVTNRDALLAFAQKNWDNGGGALVVIKPPVDAIRDFMAMHEDKLPPGIETSTFTRINIRGGSK
jgi:hypothetical protein